MADSPAFERAAEELEKLSGLDRLGARGTLRLALKSIGIDAKSATRVQVQAVVEKILPAELATRGIAEGPAICAKIRAAIADVADAGPGRSALAVFERFAGSGSGKAS